MAALNALQVQKSSACNSQVDQKRRCQSTPLLESLLYLLHDGTFSDVTFIVGPNKTRIPCHQLFLKARSSVFEVMFSERWSGDSKKEVQLEEINPTIFQMFLHYIYGETFIPNVSEALELLQVAHKYDVQLLVDKCEELLESETTLDDAIDVFQAARKYDKFALMDKVGDLMAKNFAELINHLSFSRMDKETLMYILKRSDLKMKEVDLFNLVVMWAKEKYHYHYGPTFQQSLEDLLPLIRFPLMTLEDFTTIVIPTGFLSQSTLIDLLTYFGSNNETRKSLAWTFKFSTQQRAVDNIGPKLYHNCPQVCRPSSFLVPIYQRDFGNERIRRKHKQLFERLQMCIFVVDDVAGLSTPPPALRSSESDKKNVVLSGMSLYCPKSTGTNAKTGIATPSTKEFKILVTARSNYHKNCHDVSTLSTIKAEEGKVTDVEFHPAIPLERGKYFRFIVKETGRTRGVECQDYEVKDFGKMVDNVITPIGDSRVFVGLTTGTCTLKTNVRYAYPQLIYQLRFKEC